LPSFLGPANRYSLHFPQPTFEESALGVVGGELDRPPMGELRFLTTP